MEIFLSSPFIADVFIEAIFIFFHGSSQITFSLGCQSQHVFGEEALIITWPFSGASEVSNTSITPVFLLLHRSLSPISTETADLASTLFLKNWHDAPRLYLYRAWLYPFSTWNFFCIRHCEKHELSLQPRLSKHGWFHRENTEEQKTFGYSNQLILS